MKQDGYGAFRTRHGRNEAIDAEHARQQQERPNVAPSALQDVDPRGVAWSRCPAALGRRHAFMGSGEARRCCYCCRRKSVLEAEHAAARDAHR